MACRIVKGEKSRFESKTTTGRDIHNAQLVSESGLLKRATGDLRADAREMIKNEARRSNFVT
jgi:hypothetical protein